MNVGQLLVFQKKMLIFASDIRAKKRSTTPIFGSKNGVQLLFLVQKRQFKNG